MDMVVFMSVDFFLAKLDPCAIFANIFTQKVDTNNFESIL